MLASLPDFNINSTVKIERNAMSSGFRLMKSLGITLRLPEQVPWNWVTTVPEILSLIGNYTVTKGVYRLSFYDLVKKNFTLLQGSTINWNGTPKNGDLNIKAVHIVESNSIGLIGHEIGENEKSVYETSP
ncbi:MAG: translocation/assembly module TamB domain-containing protein [Cytophagales bacterium]|nr:translocation/assembly module TamB domain-containing protein [Cytophagales bacterium]